MKTEKEFWELAETWYQRTHRLREITEKENETPERKKKALKLYLIMVDRMMKVSSMAIKIRTPKAPINYERGGI
jgi:hypothetical protein